MSLKFVDIKNEEDIKTWKSEKLKENLMIIIRDNKAKFEENSKAKKVWTTILCDKFSDVKGIIEKYYSFEKKFVSCLVIKSHGMYGMGADLDNRVGVGVTRSFSAKKDSTDYFIKQLLKDDANVLFTACSIIPKFNKKGKYPLEEQEKRKKEMKKNGDNNTSINKDIENEKKLRINSYTTAKNYYSYWVKGSKRNLFLDWTSTGSWTFDNKDGSKDKSGKDTFTDGDSFSILFDHDLVGNYKYAGFAWFTPDEKTIDFEYKESFYQVQFNSKGGLKVHKTKNIETNVFVGKNEKDEKNL